MLLMVFGPVGCVKEERIVLVGNVDPVVRTVYQLMLFPLFSLGCFLALLILASQLFLPLLERRA